VSRLQATGRGDFEAVVRTAQYLSLLRGEDDVWCRFEDVLARFFAAELTAFYEVEPGGSLVVRTCRLPATVTADRLYEELGQTVREVLSSGFLANEVRTLPESYALALLPVRWEGGDAALLIGKRTPQPFDDAELNVYLAIAGLFESTLSRLADQRRARDEQQAAARYARSLIEASLDPLVTISALGKITDVNAATEKATGRGRRELIGTDFSDYFTEPERARASYLEVFEKGLVRDYPLAIRHASGSISDVLYNATVFRDEHGAVAGAFAAARDVTDRKHAEQALRDSEERLRLAMDASESGVWDLDIPTGTFTASPACQAMLGEEPVELTASLQEAWLERLHPDDRVAGEQALRDAVEGRAAVFEHDHRLRARDGGWVWVRGKGRVVEWDADCRPRRLLAIRTNITARRAAEDAARENADRFEEQRRIAEALQKNLMRPLPEIAGLTLGMVMRAAEKAELVGGDFADVFLLDETRAAVLVGDVAGKGIRAAGLTETIRTAVRAFATIDASPAFVLRKTNELLLRGSGYARESEFVTASLVVIDLRSGHATYGSAGHPPVIHAGPFACAPLATIHGVPLGSLELDYTDGHVTLTLDDLLVLYTDGVTEARRGTELFDEQRLIEVVAGLRREPPQAVAEGVMAAAAEYAGELKDDLLVLALRFG
jgi:PAS domain S-box-containing protein